MPADLNPSEMVAARRPATRAMLYVVLGILGLFFLAPLAVMVLTSLRPIEEIRSAGIIGIPQTLTLDAWRAAWSQACIAAVCEGLQPYFRNSLVIAIPATLLSTLLGAINGYALTKFRFPGADAIMVLIILGCFLPLQAVLIPAAQTLSALGLANSIYGLILIYTVYGLPFTTLFFRNYYVGVPSEIVRAAHMDGAGFWRIFFQIMVPISWPIAMVSVVFQFTGIWNEFLFGVSFTTGASQTVTVALNNLVNTTFGVKQYNLDMAASLIAALPVLIVYLFVGRFFVRGLTAGSIKG
ncbi:carbohydrate ABC transporter membrane protein 2, CUT1 family (TC 3.A.1.1.-) [Devosia enhydra]|uniref:Carbohydrate ABC transporter membrane protein 2, CUT1 family (TC 3.A.1.1.-) n=1 Tax=Devosia enhydra TaxID=665118 RepID=A0A1K2HXT7_9HYPH|nr:carbohydrate ABC transporter permease [Devosia enhydra]SFZ84597.1 carbohydrate ABC transporter membrane protein 2, CUT1 family (TC 3.A.1.1.-) [Devosia enhydra]